MRFLLFVVLFLVAAFITVGEFLSELPILYPLGRLIVRFGDWLWDKIEPTTFVD